MKRPTWATVVGIVGIIIGCFGILGGLQLIMMPKMMEMQKEMLSSMQEVIEKQESKDPQQAPPEEVFKMMEKMWDVPDWFGTYCATMGIAALFVCGFYVFAAIRLLQTKPTAIKLFYLAAGVAIGFGILKGVFAMATASFMVMSMMIGGLFGVVINIVLLIIAAGGDKEAFTTQDEPRELSQGDVPEVSI